jgi:hypothetical protein
MYRDTVRREFGSATLSESQQVERCPKQAKRQKQGPGEKEGEQEHERGPYTSILHSERVEREIDEAA